MPLEVGIASPLIEIDKEIGSTVPPVGMAMFAPQITKYLAKQDVGLLTFPLNKNCPDPPR